MPELPDVALYVEALHRRIVGRRLDELAVRSPFLLRTFDPPVDQAAGRRISAISRMGKRIVLALEGDLFIVLHLMIAGRLLWKSPDARVTGKIDLAALRFDRGTLLITEAGTKKRASLHLVQGRPALAALDPGGLEIVGPAACDETAFAAALRRENRTIKRAITNPRTISGIGNAYSDEILHAAGLSPLLLTQRMTDEQCSRLLSAARRVIEDWQHRLFVKFGLAADASEGRFPRVGEITAFRPEFAVHGKYGRPCPVCASPVQRIIYAENECNYCATCQTGGKVLADRSLSRLLKDDWPDRIEDWETTER